MIKKNNIRAEAYVLRHGEMEKCMGRRSTGRLKENKGSSLIMTLVVVSFIAVIAMTVMTLALSSYKIKAMEARGRNAFYNADMAVDEIYSGLAADAYGELAESYDYVIGNLLEVDGDSVTMIDNTAANKLLRNTYFRNACFAIFGESYGMSDEKDIKKKIADELTAGSTLSSVNLTELSDKLRSYISDVYKDASGGSEIDINVGQLPQILMVDGAINSVIIKDVTITYQNLNTDYFSQLTTDYEIVFPEKADINIVDDDSDILQSFRDYAIVSNKYINSMGSINVNGGIYANLGINHQGASESPSLLRLTVNGGNIVTNGLIQLSQGAAVTLGNGRIWADNIELIDSDLVINPDASAYVADDLTLTQGSKSNSVTISGDYYGYSIEGHGINSADASPAKSSAIIINSKKSKLDFSNKRTLILGGYGWVVYNEGSSDPGDESYYRTGESIAVRYTQTAYVLPASWNGIINDNFFAKKLLNPAQRVIANPVEGGEYEYYYNFSSGDAAASFYRGLYDDDTFNELCSDAGITGAGNLAEAQVIRARIRSLIDEAYDDFLDYDGTGTKAITINPNARVYEKGIVRDNASGVNEYNSVGDELVRVLYDNSRWRQRIIGSLLIELEDDWMYNSSDWDGSRPYPTLNYGSMRFSHKIKSEAELNHGAVDNILKGRSKIAEVGNAYYYVENEDGSNAENYVVFVHNGDVKLSNDFDSRAPERGIIIVDGNVVVDRNFEGCIIATGDVKLEGGTYSAAPELIDTILKTLPGVRGYFDGTNVTELGKHIGYNDGAHAKQPDEKEKGNLNSYAASDCINIANYRRSAATQTETE